MSRLRPLSVTALCAATLVLASCSDTAAPLTPSEPAKTRSAQVVINREHFVEQFFDAEFFNDCTGEAIFISGVLRVRDMQLETPTSFHRTFQIITQGSGVGVTSGTVYTFHDSHVFAFNFNPRSANQTEITNAFLISKGVATNAAIQVEVHGTRSASGEITVEFEKVRAVCRGHGL